MSEQLSREVISYLWTHYGIPVIGGGAGTGIGGTLMATMSNNVMVGLRAESADLTVDECYLLKTYIQFTGRKWTGDPSETMLEGHNSYMLIKGPYHNPNGPNGWGYRQLTWESGPLYVPTNPNKKPCFTGTPKEDEYEAFIGRGPTGEPRTYIKQDGRLIPIAPWSLEECLDQIESRWGQDISKEWVAWKKAYPKGYTLKVNEERYVSSHPFARPATEILATWKHTRSLQLQPPDSRTKVIVVGDSDAEVTERAERLIALTDMCVGVTPLDIKNQTIHIRRRRKSEKTWDKKQAEWWRLTISRLLEGKKYVHVAAPEMNRFIPEVRTDQVIESVYASHYDTNSTVSYHDTYGTGWVESNAKINADKATISWETIPPCGDNQIGITLALQHPGKRRDAEMQIWREAEDWQGLVSNHIYPDSPAMAFVGSNVFIGPAKAIRDYYSSFMWGRDGDLRIGLIWNPATIDAEYVGTGSRILHIPKPMGELSDEYLSYHQQAIDELTRVGIVISDTKVREWDQLKVAV